MRHEGLSPADNYNPNEDNYNHDESWEALSAINNAALAENRRVQEQTRQEAQEEKTPEIPQAQKEFTPADQSDIDPLFPSLDEVLTSTPEHGHESLFERVSEQTAAEARDEREQYFAAGLRDCFAAGTLNKPSINDEQSMEAHGRVKLLGEDGVKFSPSEIKEMIGTPDKEESLRMERDAAAQILQSGVEIDKDNQAHFLLPIDKVDSSRILSWLGDRGIEPGVAETRELAYAGIIETLKYNGDAARNQAQWYLDNLIGEDHIEDFLNAMETYRQQGARQGKNGAWERNFERMLSYSLKLRLFEMRQQTPEDIAVKEEISTVAVKENEVAENSETVIADLKEQITMINGELAEFGNTGWARKSLAFDGGESESGGAGGSRRRRQHSPGEQLRKKLSDLQRELAFYEARDMFMDGLGERGVEASVRTFSDKTPDNATPEYVATDNPLRTFKQETHQRDVAGGNTVRIGRNGPYGVHEFTLPRGGGEYYLVECLNSHGGQAHIVDRAYLIGNLSSGFHISEAHYLPKRGASRPEANTAMYGRLFARFADRVVSVTPMTSSATRGNDFDVEDKVSAVDVANGAIDDNREAQ